MKEKEFLLFLQLFDSQFPIGSFSYSWGLETYSVFEISKEDLKELIQVSLNCGSLKFDLAGCALTYKKLDNQACLKIFIAEISAWKFIPPSFTTSLKLGRAFLKLTQTLFNLDDPPLEIKNTPHQCAIIGWVGWKLKLPLKPLLLAYAQSEIKALLSAAVRCMKISSEETQKILVQLNQKILDTIDSILISTEKHFYSSTPAWDLRLYQQKFLFTRLFEG